MADRGMAGVGVGPDGSVVSALTDRVAGRVDRTVPDGLDRGGLLGRAVVAGPPVLLGGGAVDLVPEGVDRGGAEVGVTRGDDVAVPLNGVGGRHR